MGDDRSPRWQVLYAFEALGSGDRIRAMEKSGLFDRERLHFIVHCPSHLQLRYVADDVLNKGNVEHFVGVCEAVQSGRPA